MITNKKINKYFKIYNKHFKFNLKLLYFIKKIKYNTINKFSEKRNQIPR